MSDNDMLFVVNVLMVALAVSVPHLRRFTRRQAVVLQRRYIAKQAARNLLSMGTGVTILRSPCDAARERIATQLAPALKSPPVPYPDLDSCQTVLLPTFKDMPTMALPVITAARPIPVYRGPSLWSMVSPYLSPHLLTGAAASIVGLVAVIVGWTQLAVTGDALFTDMFASFLLSPR